MCCRSKSRAIYDNPKNSSCFMTFHPCYLRFSCDAIMQPASIGCNSRVWVFPTSILQSKIRVCGAQCSNESPSGAFKQQNGLRQQMEGPCPNKFADVYTSALLATTMKPLNALPRFENHFAIETVRFQVQLEADGYFSVQKIFAFASAASRASWYQLAIFESDFTNPTSKILVGLRPNPIFSTKLR